MSGFGMFSKSKSCFVLFVLLATISISKTALSDTRANVQLALLKTEALEDSLENLTDVDMFTWPGSHFGWRMNPVFPLEPKYDEYGLHVVMNNQRVRKVYKELSLLSRRQATDLVNRQLKRIWPIYQYLYEEDIPYFRTKLQEEFLGFGIQTSNNKDGSPTLFGARYSLLALILISANLDLEDSRQEILRIAEYAAKQYENWSSEPEFFVAFSHNAVRQASLYNRRILATALLELFSEKESIKKLREKYNDRWQTIRISSVKTNISPFDLPEQRNLKAEDFLSRSEIKYLDALSDEEFNEILAAAKSGSTN